MGEPVTLVTGTRKGIGRHLALHFAGRGHVVIGCSRKPSDLEHEGYEHHCLDVSDEAAARRLFAGIRKRHGRLDHLVNNAGIASMNHALLTPVSALERVLETNVVGSFLFAREAAKLMKGARYGRIVNFSTVAVPMRLEGEAAYVASKAAVVALTQVLARELAELGITVNAVGPVPVDTDLIRGVGGERIARVLGRQAIARLGTFEDVANVVEFFLSERSGLVTGQTLYLGGP